MAEIVRLAGSAGMGAGLDATMMILSDALRARAKAKGFSVGTISFQQQTTAKTGQEPIMVAVAELYR